MAKNGYFDHLESHVCTDIHSPDVSRGVPSPFALFPCGRALSLSEPETHHFGQGDWPASPRGLPVSVPPALRSQAHVAVLGFYVSQPHACSGSTLIY